MTGKYAQWKYGTIMWEEDELDEKIEGVGIEKENGLGGPGCPGSIDTAYEEEGACVLNTEILAESSGQCSWTG